MSIKRKWINTKIVKDLYWWTCPGLRCSMITWAASVSLLSRIECKECHIEYKIKATDKINRILVEIETK